MTRAELVDRVARELYGRFGDGRQDWMDFRIDAAGVVEAVADGAEERVREAGVCGWRNGPPIATNAVLGEP